MSDNKFSLPRMNMTSSHQILHSVNEQEERSEAVKKTSFNIPIELYRRFRTLSIESDRKLCDLLQEALYDLLEKYS